MAIDDKIKDEKLQYDIKKKAAKMSSEKIGKFEYLIGKEKLLPDQR